MALMSGSALPEHAKIIERIKEHAAEKALNFIEEQMFIQELLQEPKASAEILLELLDDGVLDRGSVHKYLRKMYQALPAERRTGVAALTLGRALGRSNKGQRAPARMLALQMLAEEYENADHDGLVLFRLAQDPDEPLDVRQLALSALGRCSMSQTTATSLIQFAGNPTASADLVQVALKIIEHQYQKFDRIEVKDLLTQMVFADQPLVRRQAIAALGAAGDVDAIEQVCALPTPTAEDIDAVQRLVRRVLSRPRNLLCVSPTTFEYVIRLLLQRMGYRQVRVTRPWRDDGIDLEAYAEDSLAGTPESQRKCVVQCKRYRNAVGPTHVKEFVDVLRSQKTAQGYFITTSYFTKEAIDVAAGWRLELLGGAQLIERLDRHIGPRAYVITP